MDRKSLAWIGAPLTTATTSAGVAGVVACDGTGASCAPAIETATAGISSSTVNGTCLARAWPRVAVSGAIERIT